MSVTFKNSQFAKDGIHVTYSDESTQNLSFANKTLTVDSGLVVNVAKATLNQGLDVNNVVANLNKGLVVSGNMATLNKGLEVSEKATLNNEIEVKGNSVFAKVTATSVIASDVITANAGLNVNNSLLLANAGATVSGAMFTASNGATVSSLLSANGGAAVSGGMLTAAAGATVSGGLFTASAGATVSGGMFTASNGAIVTGTMNVNGLAKLNQGLENTGELSSTDKITAHKGLVVNNATLSANAGAAVSGGLFTAQAGATVSGGLLTASNGAIVNGNVFTANEGANIKKGLVVSSLATMSDNFEVVGCSTLGNGLVVNNARTKLNKGLDVLGNITASELVTINNGLYVRDDATVHGNMIIDGDLTVMGTKTFVNTQNLEIKDNTILIGDGNTSDVVESGFMLQYKPVGAAAPKYSGMKRVPITGELILFKDSDNQVGNTDIGNIAANNQVDQAKLALITANTAVTTAEGVVNTATAAVTAAEAARQAGADAIAPYAGSDIIAPIAGEFIIADFGVNTTLTGFHAGAHAGWSSLRKTSFLGSNDKVNFTFIAEGTFNDDIRDSNLQIITQQVRSITWPSVQYRYLKIIYESLESGYWGTGDNRFCPGNYGGTLQSLSPSALTLSSGLTGMYNQNGGSVSLDYFQVQFVANAYNLSNGNYLLSLTSPALPNSAEYSQYVLDNASLNSTLNGLVTALNTAISTKAAKVAILTEKQGLASDASALVAAKQAIARSFTADKLATVLADSFNSTSDCRLKKDVVELENALEKLDSIRGVRYNWIAESLSQERQVGVIAQEIQSVYPELVNLGGNGFLSVDYPKLTAVLIQALKELKALVLSK